MTWVCPHQEDDHCKRLNKKCVPCQKGCILEGKVSFIEMEDDNEGGAKENHKEEMK